MREYTAVIMAGGFGTRIQPLTHSTPKPMLPVTNIPMMEHILEKLVDFGMKEVVILLYYKPEVIKNYFGDGSRWGVKINYVLPDSDYGTAGAVKKAEEFLNKPFLIISGDLVTDFDLKKIFAFHEEKKSKLTITLTTVNNPLQFGIVIVNEDGEIEQFLEKPSWGEVFSDTINTGIYIIEPEILGFIPKNTPFDFSKDLFPKLMNEGIKLYGYTAQGYWRDVGNPDSYRDVHIDIFNGKVKYNYPGRRIRYLDGILHLMGEAKIDKSVEIVGEVVLDNGVVLEKGVKLQNCSIGKNTKIGMNSKIRDSIVWENVEIGENCVFDYSVICKNTIIENNVIAKNGCVIAENVKVGKLTRIEKDVTIWPDKEIEPASIVTSNVVFGTKLKNAIFENGIASGKVNTEISCDMACRLGEAFGSLFPKGAKIMVGRDETRNARMLKRAFVGGLLSTGIDVIDLKALPPTVLRFNVNANNKIAGGAYFRLALSSPGDIEIILYNEFGLRINSSISKALEKNYFNEKFRRVEFSEVGMIHDFDVNIFEYCNNYENKIKEIIDHQIIKDNEFKIVIDLMFGITKEVFPKLLNEMKIENIILNAYSDENRLLNIYNYKDRAKKEISKIVTSLKFDMGAIIFPHGQRLNLITEKGEVLDKIKALIAVLNLLNIDAKAGDKKYKVFLPMWAPDYMDENFKYLEIYRGKYSSFDYKKIKEYNLIATIDGNFAFTEFAPHRDAMFSLLKIMELLTRHDLKLSEITGIETNFYYKKEKIECPQFKKGKVMKEFLKIAKNKKYKKNGGIKVYEEDNNWVLLIPDETSEHIKIYIQAENSEIGEKMFEHYKGLINKWIA
ncbi:sugar phosphate nucleotidyltransferase [Lebetimonas sp. JS032]|uniref:sugar phosphate nucleotidyltransferase n=1 Tax=Lebetimonas sp. JS032 TaxID=990070 RepID=UPI00046663B8|nr:sugar phosphate nucleotidyltransferase [Lebetimonas sp. JS032]